MWRNLSIILVSGLVVALPFIFRQSDSVSQWRAGDPILVVISPHNEAIRYEFGQAFARWNEKHFGRPVKIDWRNIGGTTEIMRYLGAEYVSGFRAWWIGQGHEWPAGGGEAILDGKLKAGQPPAEAKNDPEALRRWEQKVRMHAAFRNTDAPRDFTCKVDVFFGGGTYDHGKAASQGLTVPPWPPDRPPTGTVFTADGKALIPEALSGETWRTPMFYGTALSTFGICYNVGRIRELGVPPPARWRDLADPRLFGQVGLADPTKSGSIAKAFEMIVQEQCHLAVRAAGFSGERVARYEAQIARAKLPPGELPEGVPDDYQAAVEQGWVDGMRLIQRMGANARYFTDSGSKVPIDVSAGDAAAGLAIDFYGRFQAQSSRAPDGRPRMVYVTPAGGSSVSADPISLLRGAEHRELAIRFMTFVLGEEGQRVWNYAPGAPGGPVKFALRRLPVRRDFYPSDDPALQAEFEKHRQHAVDDLGDPSVNPYELARQFTYQARWTGNHFGVIRDLIRAMCMDSGDELREAWKAIRERGGPSACAEAMVLLARMPDRPEPLTWRTALDISRRYQAIDYMREWTIHFREQYRAARGMAEASARKQAE